MPPIIEKSKCTGCTICAQICPLDVFGPVIKGQKPGVLYPGECWHCRACEFDCPAGAISMHYPLPMMLLHRPKNGLKKEGVGND
ncbi:MAG: ferredoxin family protein [Lachnospiraceae bacterium]|nr:ferredoxin family protein [Lachnospiraceae bacterium]